MSQLSPESEKTSTGASRREIFQVGSALLLPVLLGTSEATAVAGTLKAGPEIYQSIGVEPVINCRGTFTIIGASTELPEVRAAMNADGRIG
jgi:D-glucosaminate-6-phosphate ammonia-lyase